MQQSTIKANSFQATAFSCYSYCMPATWFRAPYAAKYIISALHQLPAAEVYRGSQWERTLAPRCCVFYNGCCWVFNKLHVNPLKALLNDCLHFSRRSTLTPILYHSQVISCNLPSPLRAVTPLYGIPLNLLWVYKHSWVST